MNMRFLFIIVTIFYSTAAFAFDTNIPEKICELEQMVEPKDSVKITDKSQIGFLIVMEWMLNVGVINPHKPYILTRCKLKQLKDCYYSNKDAVDERYEKAVFIYSNFISYWIRKGCFENKDSISEQDLNFLNIYK